MLKYNKKAEKKRKRKRKSLAQYLKQEAFQVDYNRSPKSIYLQVNRNVISNLKLKGSRPEKAHIK